ncbi:MAG: CooT family nickel-binding protein [Clostridiales Family XIII bacterium]|jgi:predicted RNA-binding protein|nr:CooT family nickel-binding protein [Clostridiales Family XIII bacterium]
MCLSSVYLTRAGGETELLCEYVSGAELADGHITFRDILGQEVRVAGALKNIDLVKNTITVEARD